MIPIKVAAEPELNLNVSRPTGGVFALPQQVELPEPPPKGIRLLFDHVTSVMKSMRACDVFPKGMSDEEFMARYSITQRVKITSPIDCGHWGVTECESRIFNSGKFYAENGYLWQRGKND